MAVSRPFQSLQLDSKQEVQQQLAPLDHQVSPNMPRNQPLLHQQSLAVPRDYLFYVRKMRYEWVPELSSICAPQEEHGENYNRNFDNEHGRDRIRPHTD